MWLQVSKYPSNSRIYQQRAPRKVHLCIKRLNVLDNIEGNVRCLFHSFFLTDSQTLALSLFIRLFNSFMGKKLSYELLYLDFYFLV